MIYLKQVIIVFLIFLFFLQCNNETINNNKDHISHSQKYMPFFGFHTDGGILCGLMMNCTDYDNGLPLFVQKCYSAGYKDIMYLPIYPNAYSKDKDGSVDYQFISPTLASKGYTFKFDCIDILIKEAKKYNMNIYVDIQGLAQVKNYPADFQEALIPTDEMLIGLIADLAAYDIAGIAEEEFSENWVTITFNECNKHGIKYIKKATLSDCERFSGADNSIINLFDKSSVIMTEDYTSNQYFIGGEFLTLITDSIEKSYSVKVSDEDWASKTIANMKNIALYKSLEYKPDSIYFMSWNQELFLSDTINDLSSVINEYQSNENKPICNLVIYLTNTHNSDKIAWAETSRYGLISVINALKASGYKIVTTTFPMDTADMYYIYTRGSYFGDVLEITDLLSFIDKGKPIFFQNAFDMPGNNTSSWHSLHQRLGISEDKIEYLNAWVGDQLFYANYKGVEIPYMYGCSIFEDNKISKIKTEHCTDAEVLTTGIIDSVEYALIIKKDNLYYINGRILELRASYILSNIINNALQAPTNCAVTSGKTSCIYALDLDVNNDNEETSINIRLPYSDQQTIKLYEQDRNGTVTASTFLYNSADGFIDNLNEGTLIILKGL